jgi:hypothetical protein
MMTRHGDKVTIELTVYQFEFLIYALSLAIGRAHRETVQKDLFRLLNAVNEGNPAFVPYEVEQ